MNAAQCFTVANTLALLGWILMLFAPRWEGTKKLIHQGLLPILLGLAYVIILVSTWGTAEGGFGSLSDVRKLFSNDWALLAGWIHYLAFDMFVGSWCLQDSWKRGIHHLWMVPIMVLTFLFGPTGLLIYGAMRFFRPDHHEQIPNNG